MGNRATDGSAGDAGYVDHPRGDVADGSWDRRHGQLRTRATFPGSLVLVVSESVRDGRAAG